MNRLVLLLLLGLVFGAVLSSSCQKTQTAGSPEKRFEFRGKVISVDKEKKRAKIEHEEIKGYMSAMTMSFAVKDEANFARLEPGDAVQATLVYNEHDNRSWLEHLNVTKTK